MAGKNSTLKLLLVGGAAAAAGASGLLGPTVQGAVTGFWHSLSGAFAGSHTAGGTTVTVSPGSTSGGCTDPGAMTADAKAKGITSATDIRAYPYGRNLWACQHHGDPSGFDAAPPDDKVTWNSVAIHGPS